MITGYECYIRPEVANQFMPTAHLNLFAKDPKNETMICYSSKYCRYLSAEEQETIAKAGSQRPKEYSVEYVDEYIRTAKENGYLVAYNHPHWPLEGERDIMAYEGGYEARTSRFKAAVSEHIIAEGVKLWANCDEFPNKDKLFLRVEEWRIENRNHKPTPQP